MNKWIEIIVGLILLVLPIYAWGMNIWGFGEAALSFFKGGLVWMLLLVGILFLIIGISEIRE